MTLEIWLKQWKELYPFDPIGEYYAIGCMEKGLTQKQVAKTLDI